MLFDLIHVLSTLLIWFLVCTGQGFVIGWLSNVFSFRTSSLLRKLCLAVMLAAGVSPCLYYFVALNFGLGAIMISNILFLLIFLVIVSKERKQLNCDKQELLQHLSHHRAIAISSLIWIIVALAMLIDVQIGDKLYLSMTMFDHSAKVAIADSISRTGVPPVNPIFFPGQPVPLLYHYFWMIPCSVISCLCGSTNDTRISVIAGVLWTGVVFLSCLSLCCKYFKFVKAPAKDVTFFTLILLLVANLYILVALPLNYFGKGVFVLRSITWWTSDQTAPFVQSMLWAPHYIAGLVAGMLGSMLILQGGNEIEGGKKLVHIVLASLCLASCFGLSFFCAIGFVAAWLIWSFICFLRKSLGDVVVVNCSVLFGIVLSGPFLQEISRAYSTQLHFPFVLGVRKFELINGITSCFPEAVQQLIYFLLLPANYLFGLGFIFVGGFLFWREVGAAAKVSLDKRQEFLLVVAVSSLLLASFVRSIYLNNDLGWRVIMIASFVFLLWSGQFLAALYERKKRIDLSVFNWLLMLIGSSTLFYGLYLDRTSASLVADASRCYAARAIYSELNQSTRASAVIQQNPDSHFIDLVTPCLGLYSHHQFAASDDLYGATMVGNHELYKRTAKEINRLFNDPSAGEAIEICSRYKLDVLVITDTDPIWSKKNAWIEKLPLLAANNHIRAYLVPKSKML